MLALTTCVVNVVVCRQPTALASVERARDNATAGLPPQIPRSAGRKLSSVHSHIPGRRYASETPTRSQSKSDFYTARFPSKPAVN
jgi:hypothetical protein